MCNQGVKFTNGTTKFVLKPKKHDRVTALVYDV